MHSETKVIVSRLRGILESFEVSSANIRKFPHRKKHQKWSLALLIGEIYLRLLKSKGTPVEVLDAEESQMVRYLLEEEMQNSIARGGRYVGPALVKRLPRGQFEPEAKRAYLRLFFRAEGLKKAA